MSAPQGTVEWFAERAGHVTASRMMAVLANGKGGAPSKTREAYMLQVVTERLTGLPVETYQNAAMAWGTEQEPIARAAYEVATGSLVEDVGFIRHPTIPWIGASPDGLLGEDGGIEIKCPAQSTVHVNTLLGVMPSEHVPQIQTAMWVTGRQWWDFVSFDPRLPSRLSLYVQRILRDESYIAEMEVKALAFLVEADALYNELMRRAA